MSWGSELWDQYDNIALHTHKGIDFLDKCGQFVKERCYIENEYASKLRRLVKNFQPKKKEEEDYKFSSCQAFLQMMKETSDMAGQHELISENLFLQIVKEIGILVKELKEERKRYLQEGAKHNNCLQFSLVQLDKAKKSYEKAFKEAVKGHDCYIKADEDNNMSRSDVEKARFNYQMKNQLCEDSKTEYANQLQKTNELQRIHFTERMPTIFQKLQDVDERRITCLRNYIKQSAVLQSEVLPIISKCLEEIAICADKINPKEDSQLVIERYKSGFHPPEDFPFEDLSNQKHNEDSSINSLTAVRTDYLTIKGTMTMSGRGKRRAKLFQLFSSAKNYNDEPKEDFSDLPPIQRKKKLQQKIDSVNSQIQQETSSRDALNKMKEVYSQNSSLGDPHSLDGQLKENGQKLEVLRVELQKYKNFMIEAEGGMKPQNCIENRNSLSDESLSRSASESSVSNTNKLSAPSTPQQQHGSSDSPESGIGTSHTSITDAEADADPYFDHDEFDSEPVQVFGSGRALYSFCGQNEGSININEGEDFEVTELDQGDGWTRVRKSDHSEGFVPTSYIEYTLYNNC